MRNGSFCSVLSASPSSLEKETASGSPMTLPAIVHRKIVPKLAGHTPHREHMHIRVHTCTCNDANTTHTHVHGTKTIHEHARVHMRMYT